MPTQHMSDTTAANFDAIIIGAGVSGLYQLVRLRELGMSVQVFEAGSDVGGTWYWNRYPGCRFDSESHTYGYSFSDELLQEWDWSERFAAQPETLRYLNHVADKFDLRSDIQFDSRVASAHFDDADGTWLVGLQDGTDCRARYLITALGPLSTPAMPAIEGIDDFAGWSSHTSRWPHEPVDFTGKRVAVVGSGATAVQLIPHVAKDAAELTVYQRTPNWCAPLHNGPLPAEEMEEIKANYHQILADCNDTFAGFMHDSDKRRALDVSEQERIDFYEQLWAKPGFAIWMANFRDILVNEEANATLSEFAANKIRERVNDPELAEKLIPTDHGFGTRRVPMETNYFEVYNQDNVELVSIPDTPIERITATGIETTDRHREHDMIIYATGFDAVTGGFAQIDFRGTGGRTLTEVWADGPRTYLGLQVVGFPNLFTLVGPHNAATFCNIPRCIEQNVEFVSDLIAHTRAKGLERVESTQQASEEWTKHVLETGERMLFTKVRSWFMNVNTNVGKDTPQFVLYAGGLPLYRQRCDEIAANDYEGFEIT
ncbi:MAG: cation diffusion facilitator CzcD-associated flavoprotein CzcO [Candidatus Poriferisodalaceae bacterium]|jgi:cation diffusion facilitator CzcD-associated flavoprotein CzcO